MIRLCIGVPGSGKSLALQDLVARDNREHGMTFIVIDHAGEWLLKTRDGRDNVRWRGQPPHLVSMAHLAPAVAGGVSREAIDFATEQRDNGGAVLVCPYPWEARDAAALAAAVGDVCFVDDEIDFCATYEAWNTNPVRMMVHRGRHLPNHEGEPCEVHVYGAARRYQNLHTDLTSMADDVLVFRVQGARTLERLEREGVLTAQQAADVQTFPDLRFVYWSSRGTSAELEVMPIGSKRNLSLESPTDPD